MRFNSTLFQNRLLVLHPFLLTLFPVVSLYANNLGQVPFVEVYRALLAGLVGAGLMMSLLRLFFHDWYRAGLLTSLASILFFSYGHVYHLLQKALGSGAGVLLPIWAAIFGLGVWWVIRRLKGDPGEMGLRLARLTRTLNLAGTIALLTCLYGFAAYGVNAMVIPEEGEAVVTPAPLDEIVPRTGGFGAQPLTQSTVTPSLPPDIYYIILDGYARADVLDEIYGVDNSDLLDFLRERGFYIADESHSNYAQTALSLASSLNFNYLDKKMTLDPDSHNRGPLTGLINQNTVVQFLKEQGYRTVAFRNGFAVTEMQAADEFINGRDSLNNFEMSLLSSSLGGIELDEEIQDTYRERILWSAGELENVVRSPGPKFVFAHFILPHPPFVFHADGSPRSSFGGGDGSHFNGTYEEYLEGYREQVKFTNSLARVMITSILENARRDPVIIIQGDHGPGSHLDWGSGENTCLRERMSILNAYYFPGGETTGLYPGITPVNSFRVVFNNLFRTRLAPLPDRSFYSPWDRPYDLDEVTDSIEPLCSAPSPLELKE